MTPRFAPRSVRGLALAIAAVAAVATLLLGGVTWLVVHEEIERQIDHRIELETAGLLEIHRNEGFEALQRVVQERERRAQPGDTGYLSAVSGSGRGMGYIVTDATGRRSAGGLDAALPPPGWSEFVRFQRPDGSRGVAQAMNVALPGAGRLVVAADRSIVDQVDLALLRIFLVVFGLILLVLAATVAGFGHIVHLRLAALRDTARGIMDGDLGRRMPHAGSDSEFDQLAGELNRMLDRISALLDTLRQVSSDIAHDLRTPLTRLRASLETAAGAAETSHAQSAVRAAIAEADEALDLFAAILAISEIEGHDGQARFAPMDLAAAARRMIDAYEPALEAAGIAVETDLSEAWIRGDAVLLQRAIANLLDNLITHTRPGTRAMLTVATQDQSARLTLADDGPGVAGGAEARIFERFVRLDAARSGPGHGLGLSLVSAVARAHDGTVSAQALDPGLRIALSLPAIARPS